MEHILKSHEIVKTDFIHGENCTLYDSQGKAYIDFESGCWCTALGHGNPRINRVIAEQIGKIIHLGPRTPNALAEEAAVDILNLLGFENGKCVFLSSGSEAVEFAVGAVRRITGKNLLLTFPTSYLAAYGSAGKKSTSEWYLLDWNTCTASSVEACLADVPFDQIGGFVFEPGGSGYGFVRFPPAALVSEIARRVKQAGGLLVANEITTGMGRTGKWFGFQHYDYQPDLVSIGKGLGNGYPVSAIAMRQEVAQKLEAGDFHYVQSHQNDPLGCAIAREVIATMREGNWIEKGRQSGAYLLDGLKRLEQKYAVVKEVRGRGALLGLELVPHDRLDASRFYHALVEKGFLVGYYPAGNMLRFDPSFTIERESIDALLKCMDEILESETCDS